MATIDSNIAMGYRPIQIENPLNQLAAVSQIQANQQGQQLNALKIKETERELGENEEIRNYLAGANLNTPEGRAGLRRFGKTGLAYEKILAEQEKTGLERTKLSNEISKQQTERNNQRLRDLSRNPSNANIQAHFEDFELDNPNDARKIEDARRRRDYLLSADIPTRNAYLSSIGATAGELKPVIKDRDIGGSIIPTVLDPYTGLPISTGQPIVKTPTIADKISQGNLNVTQQRLANETNPELIRLKSESTELGKLAAGQSPLAPKVIAANQGKVDVGDLTTLMSGSYAKLNELKGMTSTARSGKSNLGASAQSSMAGQLVGGALGTQEQSERDFIKSQRPLLVQAIVKATGITAGQINSNAELKNLLDAATDPGKGFESNARSLNEINRRFGTGKEVLPLIPNSPNIDALLEKYK